MYIYGTWIGLSLLLQIYALAHDGHVSSEAFSYSYVWMGTVFPKPFRCEQDTVHFFFFFFNLDFEKFVYYQAHYGNMHLGAATTHSGLVTSYGDTDLGQYWLSPKFFYYMADS